MTKLKFFAFLFGALAITVEATGFSANDSTEKKSAPPSPLKLISRLHSAGYFGYGGFIASHNPSADIMLKYDQPRWGYFIVKAADMYDLHSHYNFTLSMFYLNIPVGRSITISPYLGGAFDQTRKIADRGSDAMSFLTTTWRINPQISFEHVARFSNILIETDYLDWLNRFRLNYSSQHISLAGMVFSNNRIFDEDAHTSIAASASYSKIRLTEHSFLSTSITGVVVTKATDQELSDDCSGLFFSIAVSIE